MNAVIEYLLQNKSITIPTRAGSPSSCGE